MTTEDNFRGPFRKWTKANYVHSRYPDRWKLWSRMVDIAPGLEELGYTRANENPPPYPLSDKMMLAIAASMTDETKREIWRRILVNLLTPDIIRIINTQTGRSKP